MEGSLDDAMYGMMTPTVTAMRLKNFYAEDHMAKGAVLVTIDKPSATDPFRSLDVKWVESYQPPMLRSIISNRDFVYMEATGFTELRDGEMVGYRIVHSVHFPQTPKVGNNIRGNMSTCGLYRQRYHNTVEVYIRASLNSGGYAPRSYAVKYASIALISARKMIRCAHRKKLSWLLGQCDATVILGEAKCIGCGQKPGIFATYIGSCALCKRALCSPCRIKIELGYVTLRGSLVKKKMWFCTYCLDEARQTSSRVVALEEYVGTRLVASIPWSCSPTQSSTASLLDRSDD
ncbi:hypothetical protein DD238_003041 [Peronospora effusa]|uniref:FYVE-type domain-containing protein n=1 Tax=Peronospora effusa TaxID=542832 RepID=A0A3M6VK28_9STRA|nr:hypothetical protein DD238_003041 [Peronospora effusa]